MSIFQRQIDTAKRLITKNGQLVIWRSLTDNAGSKSWRPNTPTSTDYNVRVLFIPNSAGFIELLRYLKGSDIPSGSVKGLMPAVNFEPNLRDVIITPTDTFNIKSINPLAPNGDVIMYFLELEQ